MNEYVVSKTGITEQPKTTNEQYNSYVSTYIDKTLSRPELQQLKTWYNEHLTTQQPIELTESPVTDGVNWQVEYVTNPEDHNKQEVKKISSKFFEFVGRKITKRKPDGSVLLAWNQPGIFQRESEITLPTPDGAVAIKASGFVGIIMDPKQNVLLTLDQEPFATTPKQVLARTVAQTSATKLEGIIAGQENLDPKLADLLKKLGGGKSFYDMFATGQVGIFPLSPADANRMSATNFGFLVQVSDTRLKESLRNNGQNRWCNPQEIGALIETSLLNGHTVVAYNAALQIAKRQVKKSPANQ